MALCCTTSRLVLKSITRFKSLLVFFFSLTHTCAWAWLTKCVCVCGVQCDWVKHESHSGAGFLFICAAGSQFDYLWSHWTITDILYVWDALCLSCCLCGVEVHECLLLSCVKLEAYQLVIHIIDGCPEQWNKLCSEACWWSTHRNSDPVRNLV